MAEDATPLLLRKRVLAAKLETTTGTAISLTASDGAFNVYNPEIRPVIDVDDREGQGGFLYLQGIPAGRGAEITFESDLAGLGASGAVPGWADVFLPACGMTKSSATFTFGIQDPLKTLTLGLYEHGVLRQLAGCVGSFSIPLESGRYGRIRWRFMGIMQADTDVSVITPTFPTVLPPRFANASALTIAGTTPKVSRCEIDAGNELVMREDASNVAGFRSGVVVDRRSTLTIDPEAVLVATGPDWLTSLLNSTENSFSLVIGTVANNVLTISGSKAQVVEAPSGSRNKLITRNVVTRLLGESPFSIAFS